MTKRSSFANINQYMTRSPSPSTPHLPQSSPEGGVSPETLSGMLSISSAVADAPLKGEDRHIMDPESGLYVVVDGMGGMQSAELSAEIIAKTIVQSIFGEATTDVNLSHQDLGWAFSLSAKALRTAGVKSGGATVAAVQVVYDGDQTNLVFRSAGDSLIKIYRDGKIIAVNEEQVWPDGTNVTNAITSTWESEEDDRGSVPLLPGDKILICSDGITGDKPGEKLTPQEWVKAFSATDPEACAKLFIELSKKKDDKTALVLFVGEPVEAGQSADEAAGAPQNTPPQPWLGGAAATQALVVSGLDGFVLTPSDKDGSTPPESPQDGKVLFPRGVIEESLSAYDNSARPTSPIPSPSDKSIENFFANQRRKEALAAAKAARREAAKNNSDASRSQRLVTALSGLIMSTAAVVHTASTHIPIPRVLARRPLAKASSQLKAEGGSQKEQRSFGEILRRGVGKVDALTEAVGRTTIGLLMAGGNGAYAHIYRRREKHDLSRTEQKRARMVGAGVLAWAGVGAMIAWKTYLAARGFQSALTNQVSTAEVTSVVASSVPNPSAQPSVGSGDSGEAAAHVLEGERSAPSEKVPVPSPNEAASGTGSKPYSTETPVVELGTYQAKTGAGTIDYLVGQQLDSLGLDGSPKSALRDAAKDEIMKRMGLSERGARYLSSHVQIPLLSEAEIHHLLQSMEELDPLTGKPKKKLLSSR